MKLHREGVAMVLNNAHVASYLQHIGEWGWDDETLEADHWAALGDIPPIDAAMLLCRFNPNAESYDSAMLTTTDELAPEHLKRLAQRLADIDKADHRPRTLRDWHQTARGLGLTYHSWIDRYMEATTPPALPVKDTAQKPKAAAVNTAVQAPPPRTVDRGWTLKRSALIAKHEKQWTTIARDLQDASDNQLSKAAKATGHGDWFEGDALMWAEQRGKLTKVSTESMPVQATPFTGLTHRIKG